MDLTTWLAELLTASPPPTTLGVNVYPVIAPPRSLGRHCVFQIVGRAELLATQDLEADEGTRVWNVQFRIFGPREQDALADAASLRHFLLGYRDMPAAPGIMRVLLLNEMDLPLTGTARLFCRLVELTITENLAP